MRPLSLVLLLLSFALPPAAQSAELLPIAAPGVGPVRGINSPFSVAYGPDGGVAVWKVGYAIWGVPLGLDGRPAAPARWILGETNGLDQPEVRYIDGAFVLWWIRYFPHATRVAALDAELRPLDPRSIAVSTTAPLAWNGSVAITATGRYPLSYDVTVHFLDRHFARLRSDSLADLGRVSYTSAVALADGTFALIASGERGRSLIRYSPEGERLGAPQQINSSAGTGEIATDGESIVIADIVPAPAGGSAQLRTLVIGRDGTIAELHAPLPDGWLAGAVALQWANGVYTIVVGVRTGEGETTYEVDLHASRLSAEGELLEEFTPILVRPGRESYPELVRAGNGLVLVFKEGGYGAEVLFSIALPASGSLVRPDVTDPGPPISDTAARQGFAAAASDGVGWMVVWREYTATREQFRSMVLDREGKPASSPSIDASGGIHQLAGANVVFNGIDYVVAWSEWGALHARRFRTDGTPLDAQPHVLAQGVNVRPSLAAKDGVTLMSWWDGGSVRGLLFSADGSATPPLRLSPAPHEDGDDYISYRSYPVIAAGENGFLVAFAEERSFPCYFPGSCRSEYRAQAQLISRDAQLRGPLMTFDANGVVSAAGAGGTFLLALDSGRGVLIDAASATMTRAFPLTRTAAVFETGGEYTVVADLGERLLVRRFRPDGTLVRAEEVAIDGRAAAASASGALLVVSSRGILAPPYYGSAAVVAGVADVFTPATSDRRRIVSR